MPFPSPEALPDPGIRLHSPASQAESLLSEPPLAHSEDGGLLSCDAGVKEQSLVLSALGGRSPTLSALWLRGRLLPPALPTLGLGGGAGGQHVCMWDLSARYFSSLISESRCGSLVVPDK